MTAWTSAELDQVGRAEELEVVSRRRDGTMTRPVIVWVARHDGSLYIRSAVKGRDAGWFRATQMTHTGKISAGGVERNVAFDEADQALNDAIDRAFETKYRQYGPRYVGPMVTPKARSTTIRLSAR